MKFGSSASKCVCINRKEPPKLGSAGTPPPWDGGLADPLKTIPSRYVLPRQISSSPTKGVRINRKELPKLGSAVTSHPLGEGVADHKKQAPPHFTTSVFGMRQRVHA